MCNEKEHFVVGEKLLFSKNTKLYKPRCSVYLRSKLRNTPLKSCVTSKAKSLGNGSVSKAFCGRGDKTAAMPPIRCAKSFGLALKFASKLACAACSCAISNGHLAQRKKRSPEQATLRWYECS